MSDIKAKMHKILFLHKILFSQGSTPYPAALGELFPYSALPDSLAVFKENTFKARKGGKVKGWEERWRKGGRGGSYREMARGGEPAKV